MIMPNIFIFNNGLLKLKNMDYLLNWNMKEIEELILNFIPSYF